MVIYGSSLSPYVRKVLIFCLEKGIPYDVRPAGPGTPPSPEFLAVSPFQRIPAIRDGHYALADSSAIIHYLDTKHPDPALLPPEPEALGTTIWLEEFVDTILVASVGKIFFNRVVAPLIRQPQDLDLAGSVVRLELPAQLGYLEQFINPLNTWLINDTFGIADISVGSVFVNLMHSDVDISEYVKLTQYIDRVHSRASFASIIEAEKKVVGGRLNMM